MSLFSALVLEWRWEVAQHRTRCDGRRELLPDIVADASFGRRTIAVHANLGLAHVASDGRHSRATTLLACRTARATAA